MRRQPPGPRANIPDNPFRTVSAENVAAGTRDLVLTLK
jgi:hypothetical protein